jgi:activator of 2-hydroxyglutaryl-CoA dehydratase
MNEACAAGTGSFLEERAAELGVAIKNEFSQLALKSTAPIKLGERCTVFMERDVNTYMQRGAQREDVIAGLAYSVVYNYINRVVAVGRWARASFTGRHRLQRPVAAAFSKVCGKQIIVPAQRGFGCDRRRPGSPRESRRHRCGDPLPRLRYGPGELHPQGVYL